MSEHKAASAAEILRSYDGPHLRIMEVCGTHTHEIFRLGIRKLLPPQVDLISGPGCPVCVTPVGFIDEAIWLAEKGVTITTFGDLVRVPGTKTSLAGARAAGARVQVVYSPLDALEYAKQHTDEQVAFLSVGFETTVPAACLAADAALAQGVDNFSLLVANKTMPHAYAALRDSADVFLYPGHVHAITGTQLCEDLAEQGVSGVLAGFTAKELVTALAVAVRKASEGKPFFVNAYTRVVKPEGQPAAVALIDKVMEPCDSEWRGLGVIEQSGLRLREPYAGVDARIKHDMPHIEGKANPACRCGEVLRGACKPSDCPVFGKGCTPQHPVGACMVSGEGACSAYYQYGGGLV
ncbi:MAG: hydrogenase formation protein HypD [Coriobacteriales bacterium]|nr:hydrogenase formation protein HypD [Coriobacteriales bacterium]